MKRILTLFVLAAAAGSAFADSGLKPGLWEMRVLKNVVDGRDTSGQMAGMYAKMNEAMAKMPPEQRAQMEAMMKQRGVGMSMSDGGAIRMCITPEMAKRDTPPVDKDGACQPTNVHRSGNTMSYEISCVSNDNKMSGKGEATLSSDSVTTRSDITTVTRDQTHHMQTESEMKFVSSDCGDVKPIGGPKTGGSETRR